jgi:hypothetical protein
LSLAHRAYWRVVQDGIYFLAGDARGGQRLEFFEFRTRRRHPLASLAGADWAFSGGLTVSPDRKTIVYSYTARPASDILLVENFR